MAHDFQLVEASCDGDHACDPISRKLRSGMAVVWSTRLPEQGSAVQPTEGISSGESKHYATIRATAHALGIRS
eukprot:2291405-Heterocapsa_arctica.AAC.1